MKKLLFGYVIAVLLFSGLARAETVTATQLPIQSISTQPGSWRLLIQGAKTNPCVHSPRAILQPDAKVENQLHLKVMASQEGELCAQVIRGDYTVVTDVRQLVRASGLKLDAAKKYVVVVENLDFAMEFTGQDVLVSSRGMVEVSGVLMVSPRGQLAIMTADQRLVLLDDSTLNCAEFVNKKVAVVGQMSPLSAANERIVSPTLNQLPFQRERLLVMEIGLL